MFYTNYTSAKSHDLRVHPLRLGDLPLVPPAPAGARARRRSSRSPRGDAGLLGEPAARLAARRLGVGAVHGGARPPSLDDALAADAAPVRRRRDGPGAAALGWLADRSRSRWSSGRAGRTGCTTGCASSATRTTAGGCCAAPREAPPHPRLAVWLPPCSPPASSSRSPTVPPRAVVNRGRCRAAGVRGRRAPLLRDVPRGPAATARVRRDPGPVAQPGRGTAAGAWQGEPQQLALTEPAAGNAIHGLAAPRVLAAARAGHRHDHARGAHPAPAGLAAAARLHDRASPSPRPG